MESLEVGGKDAALSSPQPKASVPQKSSFRAFIVKNFSTPADRQRHAAFVGLCATNVVTSSVFSLLASFFPQIAEERGLSPFTVGAIFGSFALIIFVSSPLLGLYMSRLGQRSMLLGGLVVCSAGTFAFGFVGQTNNKYTFVTACFILRLIEGLGAAACETASTAITALLYPDSISIMVGLTETVCGLGFMIGPVVGGYLFHLGGSALPFFVMGTLGIPLLLYVARLVPEDLRSHENAEKGHESVEREKGLLWELLRRKKVLVVLLTAALSNGSYAFLDPVLEPHMVRDLPSEAARIADDPYTATGLLFFWSSLIYTLAAPVTGYISAKDRLGSDTAMFWGMAILAAGFVLLGPCPLLAQLPGMGNSMSSLFIALVMIGIGQSMALVPNMDALLTQCDDLGPSATNAVAGLLNSAYYLGAMLAPVAGSFLTGRLGFAWGTTIWAFLMGSYALYLVSPDSATCFGWQRFLSGRGKKPGAAVVVGAPAAGSGSLAQIIGRAAQGAGSGVFSGAYRRLESHLQGSDAASGKA